MTATSERQCSVWSRANYNNCKHCYALLATITTGVRLSSPGGRIPYYTASSARKKILHICGFTIVDICRSYCPDVSNRSSQYSSACLECNICACYVNMCKTTASASRLSVHHVDWGRSRLPANYSSSDSSGAPNPSIQALCLHSMPHLKWVFHCVLAEGFDRMATLADSYSLW